MRTLEFTRSATWPLILSCWFGIYVPAAADPPAVNPTARDAAESPALPNGVGSQFELTYWHSVSTSEDRHQLEAYLAQYPNGTFSGLARAKIAALDRRGASNATQDISFAAAAVPAVSPSRAGSAGNGSNEPSGLPIAAASGASIPAPATVAPVETVKPALLPPAPVPGSSMPPSLAEQLRALGQSQGSRPEVTPSAPIPECLPKS